jgi:respiratory burst oxidase
MVLLFVYIPLAMIHAPIGPVYFHAGARLWIIMLVPLTLYAWFRMPKFFFPKKTWVLNATLTEDVLVLAIDKKFTHTIGQYVTINIPELAFTEYHAFSLSNDPNSNVATMHIKQRGDWTTKLIEKREELTYVNYEGPFETVTSNFIKYRTAVIVAIGIGITPFISIINHCPPHTRVHLIFTTRQQHLLTLIKPAETVVPHMYFTRFRKSNNFEIFRMVHEAVFEAAGTDILSGLSVRTHFERPDWGLLQDIREQETEAASHGVTHKIGVFYCGPYSIEKHVRRHCGGMDFYTETF